MIVLQWGRVGEDAEMQHWAGVPAGDDLLQWGRVGEDAEMPAPIRAILETEIASMGPRR